MLTQPHEVGTALPIFGFTNDFTILDKKKGKKYLRRNSILRLTFSAKPSFYLDNANSIQSELRKLLERVRGLACQPSANQKLLSYPFP